MLPEVLAVQFSVTVWVTQAPPSAAVSTLFTTSVLQTPGPSTFDVHDVNPRYISMDNCASTTLTTPSLFKSHAFVWANTCVEDIRRTHVAAVTESRDDRTDRTQQTRFRSIRPVSASGHPS